MIDQVPPNPSRRAGVLIGRRTTSIRSRRITWRSEFQVSGLASAGWRSCFACSTRRMRATFTRSLDGFWVDFEMLLAEVAPHDDGEGLHVVQDLLFASTVGRRAVREKARRVLRLEE